jgi:alpha-glucuronidase
MERLVVSISAPVLRLTVRLFFIVFFISPILFSQEGSENRIPVAAWSFDNMSTMDRTGHFRLQIRNDTFYPMGDNRYAIRIDARRDPPVRIAVQNESALAVQRGTFSFWINYSWDGQQPSIIRYDNQSVDIQFYRRHLTPRFRGDNFEFGANNIDENWPKYILREAAFYPHDKAVAREGEWHHFAITYDYETKSITGYRDGEEIHHIDLSDLAPDRSMEPLNIGNRGERLSEIIIGDGFSGFIGEVRIYDVVLSDREIARLYEDTRVAYEGRTDFIDARPSDIYDFTERDSTLYNAWLQYKRFNYIDEGYTSVIQRLVIDSDNKTVQTAGQELQYAVDKMWGRKVSVITRVEGDGNIILGTPETSPAVQKLMEAGTVNLDAIQHDGYIIKSVRLGEMSATIIAAREPGGVIHGTFDFIGKIALRRELRNLDILNNPHSKVRMVNHWDIFRGLTGDKWLGIKSDPYNTEGNRRYSIFNWEDLKSGKTKTIRDWARLLSSAGWNAIAPTEINWEYRNNFLEHLDEVEVLAGILRCYGITLYWTPSYLHALDKRTADSLYARVPDFGGYLLKLGSEAQQGDPRPEMVNKIADNLQPYGGIALVRSFVYGRNRYYEETERIDGFRRYTLYRNTIPYAIFAGEDGKFRDNVVIINKASPLDWDLSAPEVTPLDGAIQLNMYGPEMVIHKQYPLSWVRKWKNWFVADNFRNGPGSRNMNYIDVVLGVAMISPTAAWASNPINMVNYFGLGKLAWNPASDVDEIYDEWSRLTFGDNETLLGTVKDILLLSEDVIKNLYIYRGYRGVWLDDRRDEVLTINKTPHILNRDGIGVIAPEEQRQILEQYAPTLRNHFADMKKSEAYLPYFHFVPWEYTLSNGMTVIQDFYSGLDKARDSAKELLRLWETLQGSVDDRRYEYTFRHFQLNIDYVERRRQRYIDAVEPVSGYSYIEVMN